MCLIEVNQQLASMLNSLTAPLHAFCAGYVAVSKPLQERNGERDLVIVFRGTQAKAEWVSSIVTGMVEWSELQTVKPRIKVEKVRELRSVPWVTMCPG